MELSEQPSVLKFAHGFGPDHLRMFEVTPTMLEQLTTGCRLEIRGDKDEEAVLCTSDETYLIRKVETTNMQLVIRPDAIMEEQENEFKDLNAENDSQNEKKDLPVYSVDGALSCHYELIPVPPKVEKLRGILAAAIYNGPDEMEPDNLHTLDQIRKTIQASDVQLDMLLQKLEAFELNGHYRTLSDDLKVQIFEEILLIITENDVPLDKVPARLCVSELNDYPEQAVLHCLRIHSTASDNPDDSNNADQSNADPNEQTFSLCPRKIALFIALKTLSQFMQKFQKPMLHEQFVEVWTAGLPEGVKVDELILQGHAIKLDSRDGYGKEWQRLSESKLSSDPAARFSQLFQFKTSWTAEELEPYIMPLVDDLGHSKDKMLLTLTRSSKRRVKGKMTKVYFPRIKKKG